MLETLTISAQTPVLIAGPTASGKSALALEIAECLGGVIINADSMQVYEGWRVLTARPGPEEEARARPTGFMATCHRRVPILSVTGCGMWRRC